MNSVNEFGGVVSSGGSFQVGINFSKESLGPPPPPIEGFSFPPWFFWGVLFVLVFGCYFSTTQKP